MNAEPGTPPLAADLVRELHGMLLELDPVRFRAARAAELHGSLCRIAQQFRTVTSDEPAVVSFSVALAQALDATPPPETQDAAPWVALRIAVGPRYEELVAALGRTGQRLPSLRPTNYSRNAFHMGSALLALFIIEVFPERMLWVASAFLASAVLMETSRKVSPRANEALMRAFGKVAHPYERHRINSASWYALSLVLLALFVPTLGCAVGVVVLGFGDPVAAIVGRRFGRTRLPSGRSLEGSLAFVAAATLMSFPVVVLGHHRPPSMALCIALAGAIAGAAAEVLSGRLDDNFTIPLVSGMAAWGASLVLM